MSTRTDLAIRTSGLVKTFGSFRALDGLDLEVERGEVHGFLGPNGAGKSTTIRVLLGLLRANGGSVELLGGDPWREVVALHRRLAYVPGDVVLWPAHHHRPRAEPVVPLRMPESGDRRPAGTRRDQPGMVPGASRPVPHAVHPTRRLHPDDRAGQRHPHR